MSIVPNYLLNYKQVTETINGTAVSHRMEAHKAEIYHNKLLAKGFKATIKDTK